MVENTESCSTYKAALYMIKYVQHFCKIKDHFNVLDEFPFKFINLVPWNNEDTFVIMSL